MNPSDLTSEDELKSVVLEIAFPRLVGTKGERVARRKILSLFEKEGLPLKEEPIVVSKFWISIGVQLGTLIAFICTLLILLTLDSYGMLGLVSYGILVFLLVVFLPRFSKGDFPLIGKKITTSNLVGSIPSQRESKGIVILVAHYDSKSQVLRTALRAFFFIVGGFLLLFFIGLLTIFLVGELIDIIIASSRFTFPIEFPTSIKQALELLGIPLVVCCFFLSINFTRNTSPGALDNASGIAELFSLVRFFKRYPLQNYSLYILITAAEEIGMMGAKAYMKQHEREIIEKSPWVINFDMVGRKGCCIELIEKYGFPRARYVCKELSDLAKSVAERNSLPLRCFTLPLGAATDRYIFSQYGIPSLDFVNQKASLEAHSKADTLEKFDPQLALNLSDLVASILRERDLVNE